MGTTSSISSLEVSHPLGPEWVREARQSYCAVLRNIETGQQAEQYVITTGQSIPAEFERYDYRKHQNQNLVSTWAVQQITGDGLCDTVTKLLVTNERIPLRLSEVQGLNFQDSLTVIYSAFVGFQAINGVEGYLTVTDEMIGFTPDNRVKVWLNQNFSDNHPIPSRRTVNHQYSASTMIEEIIVLVEQHSAEFSPNFRSYFYGRFAPTGNFTDALAIIRDYAQSNGYQITNKMTFAEGTTRQIITEEVRTSQVHPTSNRNISRSTVVQHIQPAVTRIQQPPVVSYIQEPQIIQQQIIQTARPTFITPSVITAPLPVVPQRPLSTRVNVKAPVQTIPQNIHLNLRQSVSPPVQVRRASSSLPRAKSPSIQPVTQIQNKSLVQNINIKPVSLAKKKEFSPPKPMAVVKNETPRKIIQTDRVQPGSSLAQAQQFLASLKRKPVVNRLSPPPIRLSHSKQPNLTPPKVQSLFEKKIESKGKIQSQTHIQTQQIKGSVVQSGAGHSIGQTLRRYQQGENIRISPQHVIKPIPTPVTISPQHPHPKPTTISGGLFPTNPKGPIYVPPKVQITETRTINIDGITTNKLEQSQDIFAVQDPKSPIHNIGPLPQITTITTNEVTQGLQNAIKEIQKTTQNKQEDLITNMKQNIEVAEDKHMIHSFGGQRIDYEYKDETSQQLLSQDVKDLLKNYGNIDTYNTSGYAIDSKYKQKYNIQDPIIIFNTDAYNLIKTKDQGVSNNQNIGVSTYQTYKQETVTYTNPSDDYEASKAKYDFKYDETKRETNLDDYDFEKKYGENDYKSSYNKVQYKAEYKTNNLGQSKYLKDYTSNEEDPLIVFNKRKTDLGERDSFGYKPLNRGGEDDYQEYRKLLKDKYDDNKHQSKYESNDESANYVTNTYDKYGGKYDSKYENTTPKYKQSHDFDDGKFQSRYEKQDYSKTKRVNQYKPSRRYSKEYQTNRYEQSDRYEKQSKAPRDNQQNRGYDTSSYERRQSRDSRSRQQKKNISYNDLKSLLYD